MIDVGHRVDLTQPDKTIIVEIYQVCLPQHSSLSCLDRSPMIYRINEYSFAYIIFLQTVCGMSVVGGDWDKLKRFNLAELYTQNQTESKTKPEANTKPQRVKTDETRP
jgi:hypothetical protein